MSRMVIKFGGTSVADIQRIRNAAKKVASEYQHGHQIIVVVSAMAGVTNKLIEMANSFEFSYVDGVDCCTVALPLPQNDEQAGNQ